MSAMGTSIKAALGRRRRGVISLFAVLAMVPVSLNYAASINNGQAVDDRIHVQDSADALTMMHSTWASRSMNVLSMNNVSATQALTVAIASEALDEALTSLSIRSSVALTIIGAHSLLCFGYLPRWWRVGYCFGRHFVYSLEAQGALLFVASVRRQYAPRHGIAVAYRALRAIDAMNREIANRFPAATGDIAESYRESFEIDTLHFADPCQGEGEGCRSRNSSDGMSLPLEEGGASARAEACLGMNLGTLGARTTFHARGFPVGRGPVTYGGSDSNPHVRDHINEITEIGERLESWWEHHDELRMMRPGGHTDFPDIANFWTRQEADGSNAFTDRFNAKHSDLCPGVSLDQSLLLRFFFRLRAPVPEFWHPIGVPPLIPGPVTPEGLDEAFHALAYVEDDPNTRIGTSELTGSASVEHFGYGQSAANNPDGASFFSQNWRPEMVPADRIDRATEAASRLSWQAPAPFSPLAQILREAGASQGVERINGH